MDAFFADDSMQDQPTREGMGPLVASGGVLVPSGNIRDLEQEIDALCDAVGLPPREEFKWSPSRDLWMRQNLVEEQLDHAPSTTELAQRDDLPRPSTYRAHFRRWNDALREAGLTPRYRVGGSEDGDDR